MVAAKRKISAVLALFLVAPFVAEYLLGDLPLKLLPVIVLMAPMYGGAAVLIRDVTRRAGRSWPTMLMLGAAYTLIEEGLVTQSLFNHDYLKMQMHLDGETEITVLCPVLARRLVQREPGTICGHFPPCLCLVILLRVEQTCQRELPSPPSENSHTYLSPWA